MTPDEKSLFLDAMDDVRPLKLKADIQWLKPQPTRFKQQPDTQLLDNFLTTGYLDVLPLITPLRFTREGVQPGVVEKLRLGKYPRQASLNLIGMTVEQCRQALYKFIVHSEQLGMRNLIVIHGKGKEDGSHANIIRSYLARWLPEFEPIQAAVCAAPQHGGAGACYVSLKKSAEVKQQNWERHAKRSR